MTGLAIDPQNASRALQSGWSPERDALVISLYMQGKSNAAIVAEANVSASMLPGMLARMRLRRAIPKRRPARAS